MFKVLQYTCRFKAYKSDLVVNIFTICNCTAIYTFVPQRVPVHKWFLNIGHGKEVT